MTRNQDQLSNGENYIAINEINHWYKVAGAKHKTTPFVIIHGGPGGNNYVFERTIGPLIETFATVIYYEQRGCGRSEAPENTEAYSISLLLDDLVEFCGKMNLEKIIPLGYSFGGELALEFSVSHPDLVEKIIAQAPSTFRNYEWIAGIQVNGFDQIATGEMKAIVREIIGLDISDEEKCSRIWGSVDVETVDKFLFHNSDFAKKNRALWGESKLINTGLMMKALLKEEKPVPLMDRLHEIEAPTLIMTGLYDRNGGLDLSRDIMAKIPNSKFIIFENSAHFPDIEESEKYAGEVKKFVGL